MNLLIDKEVDLNKKDLLQTKTYAKSLASIILNAPANTPLTIGLFGEWGSGKSSIIRTLQDDLSKHPSQKVKFVVYDAWKYSNDSFRRMFLLKVQDSLGLKQTDRMSSFYINKNSEIDIKRTFNVPYLTLVVVALLFVLACYSILGSPGQGVITLSIVLSIVGFLNTVFAKAFNEYKVTSQQPHLFAPEQFEECFNEIVGKALKKQSAFSKITNFIQGESNGDIDKLIIVIDNIDRCHKETAYELLTNTKNFIDTRLDVIFLIPVDDNALKKHIFKDEIKDGKESEEFLRKYFNVAVRIKPYKLTEIFDFAASINEENKLGFKPDTINIIAKEYASNPRRIIQFYNNLQAEIILLKEKYGENFVAEYEVAICKFLIIREEWHAEYRELCQYPEIFYSEDYQTGKTKSGNGYNEFLDSTYVSTRNIKFDALQKILVNSDNYNTLPDIILEKIKSNDFKNFDEVVKETGYSVIRIFDHFLFSLNKAIKSQLLTTEVPELLDLVYKLFVYAPQIDKSYYNRLEGELRKNVPLYIGNSKNINNLISFSNQALKNGQDFMDAGIKRYFNDFENVDNGKFYDSPSFEIYQTYITHADESQLPIVSKGFRNYLNASSLTDKLNRNLKPATLNILYTEDIIKDYLIDPEKVTWEDENNYDKWLYLAKNTPNQTSLLNALIKDAGIHVANNVDNIEYYIEVFNAIFESSHEAILEDETISVLNSINNKVFGKRSNYKYLENVPSERIALTVNYLLESYRLNENDDVIMTYLNEVSKNYGEDQVKPFLLAFLEKYPSIKNKAFKPLIQGMTEVDESYNKILLKLLYLINEDSPAYEDEQIKYHLKQIITSLQNYPDNESFLVEHLTIERAKKLLSDILVDLSFEEIQRLSINIQKLAFDVMTDKTNISRHKGNFEFLSLIAVNGNEKHVSNLINPIKYNLLDTDKLKETLQLISSIKSIKQSDADDLINYIKTNKISDLGHKKEIQEVINKLKSSERNIKNINLN